MRTRILFLIALTFTVLAAAQDVQPAATYPGTHCLSLRPAIFLPQTSSTGWAYTGNGLSAGTGPGYYYANVNLPQGAIVKKILIYAKDSSIAEEMVMEFIKNDFRGINKTIVTVTTTGDAGWGTFKSRKMSTPINNLKNSYELKLYLPNASDFTLDNIRIFYD